jgi:hypothetical protein
MDRFTFVPAEGCVSRITLKIISPIKGTQKWKTIACRRAESRNIPVRPCFACRAGLMLVWAAPRPGQGHATAGPNCFELRYNYGGLVSQREVAMTEEAKSKEHRNWPPEDVRNHMRTARAEMRESVRAVFPPEFIEHRRAARREVLLAFRSLIDRALERM